MNLQGSRLSLINRNNLNYLYCVEQYFLSLTGSGVALSPIDYQAIKSWEKKGIPLNIVCAGIKRGIESFRKTHGLYNSLPRSIKYCEGLVEEEFLKYKRLKVGAHFEQKGEIEDKKVLLRRIDTLINKITRANNGERVEGVRELYDAVCNRILNLRSDIDKGESYLHIYSEVEEIDRSFINGFCKLMSPGELAGLMEKTEGKLSPHKFRMSKEAYERTLESQRNLLVRKRYGLFRLEINCEKTGM